MKEYDLLIDVIKPKYESRIMYYVKTAKELEPKLNVLGFKMYLHGYFKGVKQ